MRVCLVSAPTASEFEGAVTTRSEALRLTAGYPPLGLLSVASVLEEQGLAPELYDLDRLFLDFVAGARPAPSFFALAAGELAGLEADLFGFGSISSSYPLTVRLAREVKRAHPNALIVFGGPQASAVDRETLQAFPFVDLVVRGEAEAILPGLVPAIGRPELLAGVPGIAFRGPGGVVRTADPPLLPDLDRLPAPALHLWRGFEDCRELPVEIGRGCPYSCTFCSTSGFFRRRFRLKSPGRVIAEMTFLQRTWGVRKFHLVHDAFTVVREKVVAFCQALAESGERFDWTCSARTDCVDEELLALMAQAGCTGVFFGIESGSAEVQRSIGKNLDLEQALAAIRSADRHRMTTAISLITGFPEETQEDLGRTVDFLLDAARFDHVQPQFHLLAPLAGAAIYERFRGRLQWDGLFSDMAFQGWLLEPADEALILAHPEVFPNFYAIPTAHLNRRELMELRDFLAYALARFRWLLIALAQYSGGPREVFDRWRIWRSRERADGKYYASAGFRRDFLEFVASRYCDRNDPEVVGITTLRQYEAGLEPALEHGRPASPPRTAAGVLTLETVPCLAPGVTLLRLGADYQRIIECLRNKESPRSVPRGSFAVADRQKAGGRVEVVQLSPLSAALMELCDGTRTVRELAAVFPHLGEGLERFPPEQACLFTINELARQEMLVFAGSHTPSGESRVTGA